MVSSIGKNLKNKPINFRFLNIYADIERTFRFIENNNFKRAKSFYNCAVEQLNYIINNEKNECFVREADRILFIFEFLLNDSLKEEKNQINNSHDVYFFDKDSFLKYMLSFKINN